MIDEIRLHLAARRPGGQDDADPAIAEAVAKTVADPQLAAWAEAEKRSDAALAAKLRQVQPPTGLRDTILAGARVSRRRWWHWFNAKAWRGFRNSEMLAAAAIVILLGAALTWNYLRGTKPENDWQAFAATQVAGIESASISLGKVVHSMPEIHAWLAAQTCPTPGQLPESVRKLKIFGCSKLSWRGEPMSIVCFNLGGGREVHLVTVSRRNLPSSPPVGSPVFASVQGYTTASWSEGDRAMMLIGKVDESELRKLMGSATARMKGAAPQARDFLAVN
jgi:hypothetical protein